MGIVDRVDGTRAEGSHTLRSSWLQSAPDPPVHPHAPATEAPPPTDGAAADNPGPAPGSTALRTLFPALTADGPVYLDSAATTQKPLPVIDAVTDYHRHHTANSGRGTYSWATTLTTAVEQIRVDTAHFLGAHAHEVVFTGGATAALNAVALGWGLTALTDGDEILYSPRDHASNVHPWLRLRDTLAHFGRHIRLIPYRTTALGEADLTDIAAKIGPRTRLLTLSHLHHVYGALSTPQQSAELLPERALLCLDCTQSAGHLPIDVRALGADFAVLAAHKMFGSPGTGVLFCHERIHDQLGPFLPGGNSAVHVQDSALVPDHMPHRMEGGTHNLPGILALGAALRMLRDIGTDRIADHNRILTRRLVDGMRDLPGLRILPGPAHASDGAGYGIVSFTLDAITATDLGFVLAELGLLVRTGAHCVPTTPHPAPGESDSVRVSTHAYTTTEEIDRFLDCLTTIATEVR